MSIAFSRTGVSTLRMVSAAQALLTSGDRLDATGPAPGLAASISQIHRDRDQILQALRLMVETHQDVTLTTPDLQCSLRTRVLGIAEAPGEIILSIPAASATEQNVIGAGRLILAGRFLARPLVCAVEAVGVASSHELIALRLVTPSWMLLANQRTGHRVHPSGSIVTCPSGWSAPVIDLSEDGLALDVSAMSAFPIQVGKRWFGMRLHDDEGNVIPLELVIAYALPRWNAGTRIGASLTLPWNNGREELKRLIGRHAHLPDPAGSGS